MQHRQIEIYVTNKMCVKTVINAQLTRT